MKDLFEPKLVDLMDDDKQRFVVFGSVAGGYLWHGGNLMLLTQPAEFVIIGGAAIGILVVAAAVWLIGRLLARRTQPTD